MSHITDVETEVKDLAALKQACSRLGFEFKEGQTSYKWYGQFVGDSPMPAGMTKEDLGKCDHAIKVPGASYEVGVAKVGGVYKLRYDYWGAGGLHKALGGQKAEKLVQAYGIEKTKKEARRLGYTVAGEQAQQDGSVKLILRSH